MNLIPDPSQRSAMVKDALDSLGTSMKPILPSDTENLLTRALETTKKVSAVCRQIDLAAQTSGIAHDRKILATVISREFKDHFGTWTKDELLYLLVFIHTDLAIDSMTGGTDTKNILSL